MRLRRISEHIRQQNWIAVSLDFIIVVAGILIAFQVTSWNQDRLNLKAEQRYLAELASNLELDIRRAEMGQVSSLEKLAMVELILKEVAPGYQRNPQFDPIQADVPALTDLDEFTYGILVWTSYHVPSDHTYRELVDTGNIGIVSDRELAKHMSRYYTWMYFNLTDDQVAIRQAETIVEYFRRTGLGFSDEASLDELIQRAETDKEFLGVLKVSHFSAHWQYSRLEQIETEARDLMEAVRAVQNQGA